MTTRIDVALKKLREAVLAQALTPGTKLPEDVIGSHFGISRTLARAALVRLSVEGLGRRALAVNPLRDGKGSVALEMTVANCDPPTEKVSFLLDAVIGPAS